MIKKLREKCNCSKKITPHTFRRSHATDLTNRGMNITDLRKDMCHASI